METIVLDTDVVINFARGLDKSLAKLLLLQEEKKIELVVPSLVVFEFYSGSSLKSQEVLETADLLFSQFRVMEVNEEIAKIAGRLNRERKLQEKIEAMDILIAATCLYLKAKLYTQNKKHYQMVKELDFYKF